MSKVGETTKSGWRFPSRRSVLSVFPAAVFAGWLGLGRRSKAGSPSPERPSSAAAAWKPVPMYSYMTAAEGRASAGAEPVRTRAVYDEQGRLVQYTVFDSGGRTGVHTYSRPEAGA